MYHYDLLLWTSTTTTGCPSAWQKAIVSTTRRLQEPEQDDQAETEQGRDYIFQKSAGV